jgi:membrane-anchored glycerophosphoryl diester phosphodiesterase (GDPDase)
VTTALALVVAARLAPALPAMIVEDRPLGAALVRAWELTRGKTGVVVGATVVFGLGYLGISMMSAIAGAIPLIGLLVQLAVHAAITPLLYVFPFALYAGAVREQQAQFR